MKEKDQIRKTLIRERLIMFLVGPFFASIHFNGLPILIATYIVFGVFDAFGIIGVYFLYTIYLLNSFDTFNLTLHTKYYVQLL